jgi:hypothetical protein
LANVLSEMYWLLRYLIALRIGIYDDSDRERA